MDGTLGVEDELKYSSPATRLASTCAIVGVQYLATDVREAI